MAKTDEATYSGSLKMRTSFFGIWKSFHVVLQKNTLKIFKNADSKAVEKSIEVSNATEVKQLEGNNGCRFQVSNSAEQSLIFSASSQTEASNWVNILRSTAFPVDTLSPERFSIISVIGRGFYGKVMLVKDSVNDELCAVKTIHKSRLIKARRVETVITERNILLRAKHPFIVGLRFAFQTDTKFYLGMEFAPGGELFRVMTNKGVIPEDDARVYIAEISLALHYLHSIGVVYRDLKPENILLSSTGHIKLTDFGLAKNLSANDSTCTFCGTTEYLAPEIIERRPYSFQVDWWSLGILTYEMMVGQTPFYDSSKAKMFESILEADPSFPHDISDTAQDFINKLLSKDPTKRMGFEQIKQHPFMAGINFDDVLNQRVPPRHIPVPKALENFDSEFTGEIPLDSIAQIPDGAAVTFQGFSYAGSPLEDDSNSSSDIAESPLVPH